MSKRILLGVTGGIAAYKAADLCSTLVKKGYEIDVIMTKNACEFIAPLTFSSLTHRKVYTDTFKDDLEGVIQHIALPQNADVFMIAPATANYIAKIANGIADDLLTSATLAATCPVIVAPAMNVHMYENKVTQRNLKQLKEDGIYLVDPAEGYLACGDTGKGKLASVDDLADILEMFLHDHPLKGKNVLVSAGPTQEAMDPVRFISNHSSGKMGYNIARAARNLGANVTLVSGPTSLKEPIGIKTIHITSANDMFEAIKEHMDEQDYIIKAAAVGDYRASEIAENKIKKSGDELTITFQKNVDILAYIGAHKTKQTVCGFAMETENLIENATEKLKKKNCDMLIANNLRTPGAGFQGDTNVITMITKDKTEQFDLMSKEEIGYLILERLMMLKGEETC